MLDPDIVLDAVTAGFRDIPDLITAIGSASHIAPHRFEWGSDNSLARTVEQMTARSILIAYQDLLEGNFSGQTRWKHRFQIYIRPANKGASPPHLWWLMMNRPLSTGKSFRYTSLLGGSLYLPDTPTLAYQQDVIGMDLFVGALTIPEAGDE